MDREKVKRILIGILPGLIVAGLVFSVGNFVNQNNESKFINQNTESKIISLLQSDENNDPWLSGWSKRVKITIDHNDINEDLTDFPVLLHLSASSGINGADVTSIFDEVGSNRKKIAVTLADGVTQCYVEVEKWDAVAKEAWLWVKVPGISATEDTILYIYYDNTQPDNTDYVGDPGETPAQNVWDDNFKLVTHMKDGPDSSHIRDSTSNGNDGTKKAAGEPTEADGKIGKAQGFDGENDYINCGTDTSITNIPDRITVEAWVKINSTGYMNVIEKYTNDYRIYIVSPNRPRAYTDGLSNPSLYWAAEDTLDVGVWYHLTYTYDKDGGVNNYRTYLNGRLSSQSTVTGTITTGGTVYLGSLAGVTYFLDGFLDEVRISNVARSAAWIKATYETGRDDLLDFGSEETQPRAWILQGVMFQGISGWFQ